MIWDLIGAICAGVGAAGIALMLRSITRKRFPVWTVPVFAGLGMLSFQIYREYSWFSHQQSLLPVEVRVVKTVTQSSPFKPWTYVFPRVVRFIAMNTDASATNQVNSNLTLTEIYLFERNRPAGRVHQVYHCGRDARADFGPTLNIPVAGDALDPQQWTTLPADDPLLVAACETTTRATP